MTLPTPLAVLGLAVAFAYPAISVLRRNRPLENPDWSDLRRSLARRWAFALAVLALVAVVGAPADVAFQRPPDAPFLLGVLSGAVALFTTVFSVGFLARRLGMDAAATPLTAVAFEQSLGRTLLTAFSVAFVESVLFYGYTVQTVAALGAPAALGGVLAALGATLTRARGGVPAMAQWFPGALVLAGVAVWTRSVLVVLPVLFLYTGLSTLGGVPERDTDDGSGPAEPSQ